MKAKANRHCFGLSGTKYSKKPFRQDKNAGPAALAVFRFGESPPANPTLLSVKNNF
jgi:hypothetical protein